MVKKLTKSSVDKKISGVCGGIGEYFSIDATLIRIIWILFSFTGTGVLAYIICALIIPENTGGYDNYYDNANDDRYQQ